MPDVFDNDSNVFILAMSEPNWAGYFDPGNQMSEGFVFSQWGMHSNQREIIYITADYFESDATGIVAHEFGHLLHWKQDHSPDPPASPAIYWETAFVDEGFSTFAAMYLTEDLFQGGVFDYSAYFAEEPDIPLIYFTNYDQAKLFMLFMFEHYGGWSYISSLISNQLNGQFGVDSTLHFMGYTQHFEDVFEQFCIANYADDSVFEGGKYSYLHFNFPACKLQKSHTTFPVLSQTSSLTPFGAEYTFFRSLSPKPVQIEFNGDTNSKFRLAFILVDPTDNSIYNVVNIALDSDNHGIFVADSFGTAYKKIIMVAMNTDGTLAESDEISYSYNVSVLSGCEEISNNNNCNIYPNPAKEFIIIDLPFKNLECEIFNVLGEKVESRFIAKSGKTINVQGLSKGLYFVKFNDGNRTICGKFIKD
jgi:hypothetical protein